MFCGKFSQNVFKYIDILNTHSENKIKGMNFTNAGSCPKKFKATDKRIKELNQVKQMLGVVQTQRFKSVTP